MLKDGFAVIDLLCSILYRCLFVCVHCVNNITYMYIVCLSKNALTDVTAVINLLCTGSRCTCATCTSYCMSDQVIPSYIYPGTSKICRLVD